MGDLLFVSVVFATPRGVGALNQWRVPLRMKNRSSTLPILISRILSSSDQSLAISFFFWY